MGGSILCIIGKSFFRYLNRLVARNAKWRANQMDERHNGARHGEVGARTDDLSQRAAISHGVNSIHKARHKQMTSSAQQNGAHIHTYTYTYTYIKSSSSITIIRRVRGNKNRRRHHMLPMSCPASSSASSTPAFLCGSLTVSAVS